MPQIFHQIYIKRNIDRDLAEDNLYTHIYTGRVASDQDTDSGNRLSQRCGPPTSTSHDGGGTTRHQRNIAQPYRQNTAHGMAVRSGPSERLVPSLW